MQILLLLQAGIMEIFISIGFERRYEYNEIAELAIKLPIHFDKFIKLIYKSWTKRDNYVIIKLKVGRGDKSGTIDCNACL